jgi:hypothetical protein
MNDDEVTETDEDANLALLLDGTAGGYGEDAFLPTCPICFDPIDYCLGHGELG